MPCTLIRMAQARRADPRVEQREVDRMEDAVAGARQRHEDEHHRVAGAGATAEHRHRKQRDAANRTRPRPIAVDDEARQRLDGARDDEEHRQQQSELRIAHAEAGAEPREQRRHASWQKCDRPCATLTSADRSTRPGAGVEVAAAARRASSRCDRRRRRGDGVTIDRQVLSRSCQRSPAPARARLAPADPARFAPTRAAARAREGAPARGRQRDRAAQPPMGAGGDFGIGRRAHHGRGTAPI